MKPVLAKAHRQRQVQLPPTSIEVDAIHREPGSSKPPPSRRGEQKLEQDLEERRVTEAAIWIELGHKLLEGKVLMRRPVEHGTADAFDERAEGRASREVNGERQGVGEEADSGSSSTRWRFATRVPTTI